MIRRILTVGFTMVAALLLYVPLAHADVTAEVVGEIPAGGAEAAGWADENGQVIPFDYFDLYGKGTVTVVSNATGEILTEYQGNVAIVVSGFLIVGKVGDNQNEENFPIDADGLTVFFVGKGDVHLSKISEYNIESQHNGLIAISFTNP